MGASLSTVLLLGGSLVAGGTTSVAAYYASKKKWSQAEIANGIAASVALLLLILCIILVVRKRGPTLLPGIIISFVFLISLMIGILVGNVIALIEAAKKRSSSKWWSIGTAVASFLGFIASLIIIVILA